MLFGSPSPLPPPSYYGPDIVPRKAEPIRQLDSELRFFYELNEYTLRFARCLAQVCSQVIAGSVEWVPCVCLAVCS